MLDTGQMYSLTPGKDRLLITHLSGPHKPSHIAVLGQTLFRVSTSSGGGRLYSIMESAGEDELKVQEIGGKKFNELYYGPIIDAIYENSDTFEEKIVALCGQDPVTVREFISTRRISMAKMASLGPMCKKMWIVEFTNETTQTILAILLSYIASTALVVGNTEGEETLTFEGEMNVPIVKTQATIYASAFKGMIIQVTSSGIRTLGVNSILEDVMLGEVVTATSGLCRIHGKQEYVIAVCFQICTIRVYMMSSKGTLHELFEWKAGSEVKSIITANNMLLSCSNESIIAINLEEQQQISETILPVSIIPAGILGDSIRLAHESI